MSTQYDVVVVGGRVAGASTAMLLARAGARVALLDRSSYGSDTVSTHGLMRGGVLQLSRWGLLDEVAAAGTPPIRQTLFEYADGGTDRVTIRASAGVDALRAPAPRARPDPGGRGGRRRRRRGAPDDDDGPPAGRRRPGARRPARVAGGGPPAPGRDHGGRRRHPLDRRRPGGRSLPAARPRRERGPLPLLRRHRGNGLRVGVGGRRRRRLHSHQRRARPASSWPPPRLGCEPCAATGRSEPSTRSSPRRLPAWPAGSARRRRSAGCTAGRVSRASSAGPGGRAGRWSGTPATSRTRSPCTASPTPCATPSC